MRRRRDRRRRRRRFSRSEFFNPNASRDVQLGCFLRANKTRFKAFFIVVILSSSRRRHHRATMAATRVILEDVRGRRRRRRRRHDDPFAAARSLWRFREYFLYLKDTNFPHTKTSKTQRCARIYNICSSSSSSSSTLDRSRRNCTDRTPERAVRKDRLGFGFRAAWRTTRTVENFSKTIRVFERRDKT